ncbi:bpX6 domain-containing protein, partial [Kitasatospora sp. NPDC093806]|uniref:bpX6 domain-containing protein n=1 Tax=Kitasatospora sp. NPDC093806 TaxID=3155075 RepID=UPI0034203216
MNAAGAGANAAGFVLDVPLIGPAEAADRVLALWSEGARLRELPDGCWLLTLPEEVPFRPDRAPGVPLERRRTGALAATGTPAGADAGTEAEPAPAGQLVLTRGGQAVTHTIAELPETDPSGWLSLAGLTLHRPRPVGAAPAPEAAPVDEALPAPGRPDLRAVAGIKPPSERARRLIADAPGSDTPGSGASGARSRWRAVLRWPARPAISSGSLAYTVVILLLAVLPGLFLATDLVRLIQERGFSLGGVCFAVLVGSVVYRLLPGLPGDGAASAGTAAAGTAAGTSARAPRRRARRPLLGHLLARLTLHTPAARLLYGRHMRYLHDLTRAFEQQRWEDALRDAFPLAAPDKKPDMTPGTKTEDARTWLSLALPRRFTGALRPTPQGKTTTTATPFHGATAHQHLTALYRQAAERLAQQGRIDEAAYVLADLLDAPEEAVALLDRHGRSAQAAELAEGRDLAADLVVRLWWRAGDRDRAVRTAHRRGAFATAVERLAATDPASARGLRVAWAEHCRAAGDRFGAVEAVWPDE